MFVGVDFGPSTRGDPCRKARVGEAFVPTSRVLSRRGSHIRDAGAIGIAAAFNTLCNVLYVLDGRAWGRDRDLGHNMVRPKASAIKPRRSLNGLAPGAAEGRRGVQ